MLMSIHMMAEFQISRLEDPEIVNFTCQFNWSKRCLGSWKNIILEWICKAVSGRDQCHGLDLECPPKIHVIKGLVHSWCYWREEEPLRGILWGVFRLCTLDWEIAGLNLFSIFFMPWSWTEWLFALPHTSCHDVLPLHRSHTMRPPDHGLKLLRL
jgi:hypothetical protein